MPEPVFYTNPPTYCDTCNGNLHGVFYDARLRSGPWANMCYECFCDLTHNRLGPGIGQKYRVQDDGRWLKVEG